MLESAAFRGRASAAPSCPAASNPSLCRSQVRLSPERLQDSACYKRCMSSWAWLAAGFLVACGTTATTSDAGSDASVDDAATEDAFVAPDADAAVSPIIVYAASATALYTFDPVSDLLAKVGAFGAVQDGGAPDSISDIAVGVDGKIWAISATNLYGVSPSDGHVTLSGPVSTCGNGNFALGALAGGKLATADGAGTICSIDTTTLVVTPLGSVGHNLALYDLVTIGDGTVYATAIDLTNAATKTSNLLVTLDATTGAWTSTRGATGFPSLYGVAWAQGKVLGFSHDGSGHVVLVDPTSGAGTLAGTFLDPDTQSPVVFAGAAVSPAVSP